MNINFEYAQKVELTGLLPQLFQILYSNMKLISPTRNTYAEDYEIWFSNVLPALNKPQRQIVLMFDGNYLIGFFQYYVNSGVFMMEEIQIKKVYHGTGVFSAFFKWLLSKLPSNVKTVEAFTVKENLKSQAILTHLGLVRTDENDESDFYRYSGEYEQLKRKYLSGDTCN